MAGDLTCSDDPEFIRLFTRPFLDRGNSYDAVVINPDQESPIAALIFHKVNSGYPGISSKIDAVVNMILIPRDGASEIGAEPITELKDTEAEIARRPEGGLQQYLFDKKIGFRNYPHFSDDSEILKFIREQTGIKDNPLRISVFRGNPRNHETAVSKGEDFWGQWVNIKASPREHLFRMLKMFEEDRLLSKFLVGQIVKNVIGIDMQTLTHQPDPSQVKEGVVDGTVVPLDHTQQLNNPLRN